ncbi:hypothetical protein [Fictibacillus nanhaiensis]
MNNLFKQLSIYCESCFLHSPFCGQKNKTIANVYMVIPL